MARFPRVVLTDVPHHITQRGNAQQPILAFEADKLVYLALLREYSALHRLSILGYCLMSNHIHLIAIPRTPDSLARTLKHTHGRFASYWNARRSSNGHAWQGRFYSCALDESHLWNALRYVELNPVRAGIVAAAENWPWSSAALHSGREVSDTMLDMERWSARWTVEEWRAHVAGQESEDEICALRRSTHTGRPLGTTEFVAEVEKSFGKTLVPRKGGRPKKTSTNPLRHTLTFVA